MRTRVPSWRTKHPWLEGDRCQYSAEFRNDGSCTFRPSYAFISRRGTDLPLRYCLSPLNVSRLSGKYPSILNISRTVHVALMWLGSQSEETYSASVNSHSPVRLVIRQWDAVDWACVLCDRRIQNDGASRSASARDCACPLYSPYAGCFGKPSHHPGRLAPLQRRFVSLRLLAFPKAKIAFEMEEICECDVHKVHKLSQRRVTADWLASREGNCSRTHSKVSSD